MRDLQIEGCAPWRRLPGRVMRLSDLARGVPAFCEKINKDIKKSLYDCRRAPGEDHRQHDGDQKRGEWRRETETEMAEAQRAENAAQEEQRHHPAMDRQPRQIGDDRVATRCVAALD